MGKIIGKISRLLVTVTKVIWYGKKVRHTYQWIRIENQEQAHTSTAIIGKIMAPSQKIFNLQNCDYIRLHDKKRTLQV